MSTQQQNARQQVAHHDGCAGDDVQEDMVASTKMPQGSQQKDKESRNNSNRQTVLFLVGIALLIGIVLAIAIPLSNRNNDTTTTTKPPDTIDFAAGLSLITHYAIDAIITSRLAQTRITMEVANALDCPSVHSTSILIPRGARVASLQTISKVGNNDKECITTGKVKKLADARQTFLENAADGLPGAYVEEQVVASTSSYSLQISIPSLGQTRVELVLEELLSLRAGQIEFEIPFTPNEGVDQLQLDLKVLDIANDDVNITIDNTIREDDSYGPTEAVSHYKLRLTNAREYRKLDKTLRGRFKPGPIDTSGALYSDGSCFEHYFIPSTLVSMARNLIVVIDNSAEYGHNQFYSLKQAVKRFIHNELTPDDTLTIQTYSHRGNEILWGSAPATEKEKNESSKFINSLEKQWQGNLHDSILLALLRAKRDADASANDKVNILTIITDGRNVGPVTKRELIDRIYDANKERKVKLVLLGTRGADMPLLRAIALTNGGIAEQRVDLETQLESFYQAHIGTVLAVDVNITLAGPWAPNLAYSDSKFPLLSSGTEVVVRGLLSEGMDEELSELGRIITSASTKDGREQWIANVSPYPSHSSIVGENTLCSQSYAHNKITRLMELRDSARLLDDSILLDLARLSKPCDKNETVVQCIEKEAASLAIESNLVARGLTGMVTEDDMKCLSLEVDEDGKAGVCRYGIGRDFEHFDEDFVEDGEPEMADDGRWHYNAASTIVKSPLLMLCCVLLISLVCWPNWLH